MEPEGQKSQSPYGAPSLVEIVVLLGAKTLVTDNVGFIASTVVEALAVPPAPVHVSEYVRFPAAFGVTFWLPLVCGVPTQAPLAMQDVAFVEDQVRVRGCPTKTLIEFEEMLTVGAFATVGLAELLALPPPLHAADKRTTVRRQIDTPV